MWGTYPLTSAKGDATQTEIELSQYMQGAWAAFAKNPSNGPGWPRLGSTFAGLGPELAILGGSGNPSGEQTVPLVTTDAVCALYDPLLRAANQAY